MLLLLVDRPQIYHINRVLSVTQMCWDFREYTRKFSFILPRKGILPLTPRSIDRSSGQLRDGSYIYFKYEYYIYIYTL